MSIYQQNDALRVVWNRLLLHPMACEEDRLIANKVFEQSLNARYPAEPAPVVTDEAVEASAAIIYGEGLGWPHAEASEQVQSYVRDKARTALEAAAPLLGPRPLLDQGDVFAALDEVYTSGAMGGEWSTFGTDAVMELARPMPTQEQIAEALDPVAFNQCKGDASYDNRRKLALQDAAAVLALLNGGER